MGRVRRKRLLIVLATAGVALIGIMVAGVANYAAGQRKAAAFALPSMTAKAVASATPTPIPRSLQAACSESPMAPRGIDRWITASGTQAGYRAHGQYILGIGIP